MVVGVRNPGEFCWINVFAPDSDKIKAFFEEVLGWAFEPMGEFDGFTIHVAGRVIGALFQESPPGIYVVIKVDSCDATSEKIKAHGGAAKAPMDIGKGGRMAVCQDPNGAKFDIWEAKASNGTEVDSAALGAPSWYETLTSSGEAGEHFYSQVFGWDAKKKTPDYTSFALNGKLVAGLMEITPAMGNLEPHWGVYFNVADVDATAELAAKLGATICVPPKDIPEVGRFCGIVSPEGICFYAIKYNM